MGAVFALFSGWYFWIPKILGLDYNILLSKVHFWILFIGVRRGIFNFYERGKRFNHQLPGGSPNDNFIMFFKNVKESKKDIYKELRRKSGVYFFINNITKDLYVGSSLNLSKRMTSHFYHANSDKVTRIVITRAMRKYGLDNFSLAILELCDPDIKVCSNLEQKWIDYYRPRYNVLKIAGSSSGFSHKIDTINKLKELFRKENHPNFGKTSSPETRKAISDGIKNFYLNNSLGAPARQGGRYPNLGGPHPAMRSMAGDPLGHSSKGLKGKLSPQYGIGGHFVFCYNKKGEELTFPSINGAKQHFKVRWTFIKQNIDTQKWVSIQNDEWIIQSTPRKN